jgi:hypothetical protein
MHGQTKRTIMCRRGYDVCMQSVSVNVTDFTEGSCAPILFSVECLVDHSLSFSFGHALSVLLRLTASD